MPRQRTQGRTHGRTHALSTALAAAVTTALATGLAGCAGGDGPGADSDGGSGTAPSASRAEPGKYETLPEPCKVVGPDVLSELLPVVESVSDTDTSSGTPRAYEGERSVTYDADRRVGCRWKSSTSLGSRHLHIDFQRVVSYDGDVSDEDKAAQLYADKARAADIPHATPSGPEADGPTGERDGKPSPTPSTASSSTPPSAADTAEARPDADTPHTIARQAHQLGGNDPVQMGVDTTETGRDDERDDSPAETPAPPDEPDASLASRTLEGIGDAAFIDDVLDTTDSGVHRDITLVFRTSNVLVTVEYSQWMTDKRRIPASAELQEKAEALARKLTSAFED